MNETINKTPYEKFDVVFDFSDQLAAADTVVAIDLASSAPANLVTASTFDTKSITVTIAGGTTDTSNALTVRCTTILANKLELQVPIDVKSGVLGNFDKSPSEAITVASDFVAVMAIGDSISTFTVTAVDNSTGLDATITVIAGSSINSTAVQFSMIAGTVNVTYTISVKVVTVAGKQFETILAARVKEQL